MLKRTFVLISSSGVPLEVWERLFQKKGVSWGECVAGGQGKLQQLLINMHALSFFFPSVEEEDEDEEMAEVKPGLESEQPDEDDSRETKEGAIPGRVDGSALFFSGRLSCCWPNAVTCV